MTVDLAWQADSLAAGTPLILLHSLGHDRSMWDPQVKPLARDRRLIRVDLRGHGRSPAPASPYRLEQLGSDVVRVADAAGAETFDLCGLSLGGQVALWVAAHHPGRVRRLVACATGRKIGNADGWNARIAAVRDGGMASIADLAIGRFFSSAYQARCPATVDRARAVLRDTDAEGYIGCCTALRDADLTGTLGSVRAPTLLIAGSADESTPPPSLYGIAEEIPRARVEVLEGAGHLLNLEVRDRFAELVRAHLEPGASSL